MLKDIRDLQVPQILQGMAVTVDLLPLLKECNLFVELEFNLVDTIITEVPAVDMTEVVATIPATQEVETLIHRTTDQASLVIQVQTIVDTLEAEILTLLGTQEEDILEALIPLETPEVDILEVQTHLEVPVADIQEAQTTLGALEVDTLEVPVEILEEDILGVPAEAEVVEALPLDVDNKISRSQLN